jgi:hypothetical protein
MAKPIRIALLVVLSLAALMVAAVLLAWLLFDADRVRGQLEAGLGDALGMDVQIGQPVAFGLSRGASVTLADLEVSRQGQVVATAEGARVRVALFSLLAGDVRPLELHLQRADLSIERFSPGVFNVYPSETEPRPLDDLSLRRLQVSDARLSYLDHTSGLGWLFEHCDLDLGRIRHAGGAPDQARASLAADGTLKCQSLSQEQFAISLLSVRIRGDRGVFDLMVDSGNAFNGQISARLEVDLSSSPPGFRLTSSLSQFEFDAFMAMQKPEQATSGKLDIELVLTAQGGTWQEVRNSTAGTLRMTAGELVLDGYDLDDELDGYAATQRFNLIDVGAVFLAGPVGLVASRGYAFTGLLEGSGGSTRIVEMVSIWTVEGGVAQAHDVAFRTPENRLALAGGLDFTQYRFKDMQVAVLDRDGCAIVEQKITGPFREPEVTQPNFLVSVAGPLLDLVKRGLQAISDKECEAFYTGSIPHP